MSLTVSHEVIAATTSAEFERLRQYLYKDRDAFIDTQKFSQAALSDLLSAATQRKDTKTVRAIESISLARSGRFDKPIPSFKAFQGVIEEFFKADLIDGWLYSSGQDGKLYPELITEITYDEGGRSRGSNPEPFVTIHTACYGLLEGGRNGIGASRRQHIFQPRTVAKRRISEILLDQGLYKETQALRADYMATLERHHKTTQSAFAKQFRVDGAVYKFAEDNYQRKGLVLSARRVIHDLEPSDCGPVQLHCDSYLFEDGDGDGVGAIPQHPIVKVFDLVAHEFFWVHADNMSPYRYDHSLRDKLVLPASHRDLLDVLTTDLGAFVNDFVEGKSAGNVILCKGAPGVGKTLTAEVYSELIERPLYSIHSGSLGTSAKQIEENLSIIFQRAEHWGCALLLDEADVFVVQRGNNIEQNAIVAEFLRTLEYFNGLLFMTTNRANDIDEAIISRCAAIIDYPIPTARDAAAIWRVMANQFQAPLSDELITGLVELFPKIAPRDIKMLFRLALRVAKGDGKEPDLDTFRRCAMFRAIEMQQN